MADSGEPRRRSAAEGAPRRTRDAVSRQGRHNGGSDRRLRPGALVLSREDKPFDLATLRQRRWNASPSGRRPPPGWTTRPTTWNGFPRREATLDWPFWDRYRRYLGRSQADARQVVWRIDETTDRVLGKLEDPTRAGRWRRDGLVAGHVQSGKTANYIGLICKAADAGYKLIVILAGIDNSLRSQTQLRVDEGFLGFDTQYQQRYDEDQHSSVPRCRRLPGRAAARRRLPHHQRRDWRLQARRRREHQHPDRRLSGRRGRSRSTSASWTTYGSGSLRSRDEPTGPGERKIVHDVPVLVIDDEADNASVNVGEGRGHGPFESQRRDPRSAGELRQGRLCRVHGHAVRQHLHRPGYGPRPLRPRHLPPALHREPAAAIELPRAGARVRPEVR